MRNAFLRVVFSDFGENINRLTRDINGISVRLQWVSVTGCKDSEFLADASISIISGQSLTCKSEKKWISLCNKFPRGYCLKLFEVFSLFWLFLKAKAWADIWLQPGFKECKTGILKYCTLPFWRRTARKLPQPCLSISAHWRKAPFLLIHSASIPLFRRCIHLKSKGRISSSILI